MSFKLDSGVTNERIIKGSGVTNEKIIKGSGVTNEKIIKGSEDRGFGRRTSNAIHHNANAYHRSNSSQMSRSIREANAIKETPVGFRQHYFPDACTERSIAVKREQILEMNDSISRDGAVGKKNYKKRKLHEYKVHSSHTKGENAFNFDAVALDPNASPAGPFGSPGSFVSDPRVDVKARYYPDPGARNHSIMPIGTLRRSLEIEKASAHSSKLSPLVRNTLTLNYEERKRSCDRYLNSGWLSAPDAPASSSANSRSNAGLNSNINHTAIIDSAISSKNSVRSAPNRV